jgi:hypothetical protein
VGPTSVAIVTAHDVRCAELSRQRDPIGMATEDDDLLSAEAPGGDDAAQADGAVSNNGHRLPRADFGRTVSACADGGLC